MSGELLDGCFKCRSRDSVHFVLVSTNSAGGKTWKIKCEKCGLTSIDESIRERLVKWWNDRTFKMPPDNIVNILKAVETMDETLEKKGKVNKNGLKENLAKIKEQLGITDQGGKE